MFRESNGIDGQGLREAVSVGTGDCENRGPNFFSQKRLVFFDEGK